MSKTVFITILAIILLLVVGVMVVRKGKLQTASLPQYNTTQGESMNRSPESTVDAEIDAMDKEMNQDNPADLDDTELNTLSQ